MHFGRKEWVTAIKKFYKRNGKVSARLLQQKKPQLYHQGAWLFGSWDNALRAAGFTPEKVRLHKVWDREKVIEAIRELRDQNRQLNAHYANKNYTSLFTAGVRYYGDWGRALAAAGMSNTPTLTNATARRKLLKRLRKTSTNSRATLSKSLRLQAELRQG